MSGWSQARGWTPVAPGEERESWARVWVDEGQGRAILLRFSGAGETKRVLSVHDPAQGVQLFAVPEVIAHGEDWCLVEDIAGVPLMEVASGEKGLVRMRQPEFAEQLGTLLRKLHEAKGMQRYGDVLEVGDRAERVWQTFNGFVAARLERFVEAANQGGFDVASRVGLLDLIGSLRHELSAFLPRQPASLHHGTVSPRHVWVDPDTERVVALTGFEQASYLPPGLDIAYLFYIVGLLHDEAAVRAFYRGYGSARTMDVQRREKFYGRLVLLDVLFGFRDGLGAPGEALLVAALEGAPVRGA
jgi:aminoglycoside phosphotransferase (APT) family kinase protein